MQIWDLNLEVNEAGGKGRADRPSFFDTKAEEGPSRPSLMPTHQYCPRGWGCTRGRRGSHCHTLGGSTGRCYHEATANYPEDQGVIFYSGGFLIYPAA